MLKNVLVTGGAGYIGSHTCKILKQNGFLPITFDNLSTGHREFVKWGPLFEGDLLNQSEIDAAFDQYKIELVMHFAAKAYVNESVNDPIKYYRENIQGSINLLETSVKKM
jgi:UDP-glucose 4-epimerase